MTDQLQAKAYAFSRLNTATYLRDFADSRNGGRGIDLPDSQLFQAPLGGIDALDSGTAGTAMCTPYQLAEDGTLSPLPTPNGGATVKVFNITESSIAENTFFVATRSWDKYLVLGGGGGLSCQGLIDLIEDPDCDICEAICRACNPVATQDGTCDPPPPETGCCAGFVECQYDSLAITNLIIDEDFGDTWNQNGNSSLKTSGQFCTWLVPVINAASQQNTAEVTRDPNSDFYCVSLPGGFSACTPGGAGCSGPQSFSGLGGSGTLDVAGTTPCTLQGCSPVDDRLGVRMTVSGWSNCLDENDICIPGQGQTRNYGDFYNGVYELRIPDDFPTDTETSIDISGSLYNCNQVGQNCSEGERIRATASFSCELNGSGESVLSATVNWRFHDNNEIVGGETIGPDDTDKTWDSGQVFASCCSAGAGNGPGPLSNIRVFLEWIT